MSAVFLSGSSGRLGTVIAETLRARGDTFRSTTPGINYAIFAHRYRGSENFTLEMEANVQWVAECIDRAKWLDGDCAIVVVSSINADTPALNQTLSYNASKAALNNLVRYYAIKQKVRINSVSPGTFTGENPAVTKEEVANVIAFLCSAEASGINGQNIRVARC